MKSPPTPGTLRANRLRAQPDSKGVLRLEVRNEALETHYINQLQLLEVRHAADEFVLPDAQGRPIVVNGVHTPADIAARSGENLSTTLSAADNTFYSTDPHAGIEQFAARRICAAPEPRQPSEEAVHARAQA
jgi:hypothetical protein